MAGNETGDRRGPLWERYSRQMLFEPLGEDGQRRLERASAVLIGCGALGSVLADLLVRAGVGRLRIIDRDYLELNNLQRQVLFDEADLAADLPKAAAASAKLARINSRVKIDPCVVDANRANIESLVSGAEMVLDGTDNFETRFLINDVAVKHGLPWVYGACLGAVGMVMPIIPRRTPCLRCVWEQAPPPGTTPTCDTAGVLGPVVHLVAGLQASEALKWLSGRREALNTRLVQLDVWSGRIEQFDMQSARGEQGCVCCGRGRYEYLSGERGGGAAALCGRGAVQVQPAGTGAVDLEEVASRVSAVARDAPRINRFMLRFTGGRYEIALFRDGRAIVKGTEDLEEARSAYAKYVGG